MPMSTSRGSMFRSRAHALVKFFRIGESVVMKIAFVVCTVAAIIHAEPEDSIAGIQEDATATKSSDPKMRIQLDLAYTRLTNEDMDPEESSGRELHFFLGFMPKPVIAVGPFFNYFGKDLSNQTGRGGDGSDYSYKFFGAAALARFSDPSKTISFTALLGAGRLELTDRLTIGGVSRTITGGTMGYMVGAGGEARLHEVVHLGVECRGILGKISKLTLGGGESGYGWYSVRGGDVSRISFGGGLRFVI